MGINPTMSNFKSLTFDGKTSREYGVYITGEGVFNAPEKDVELVTIPGRNGDYALDHGRFSNIQVTYPASIAANNETDFRTAVSDFRNWLCSRKGYCVLSDEYNPSEYRLAVYKSGLEVTHDMLIAGEFNIVFDCKPQRFLTSGDTPVTLSTAITPTTATGSLVTFTATSTTGLVDLDTDIDPIQDLSNGDPSPSNICPISGSTEVNVLNDPKYGGFIEWNQLVQNGDFSNGTTGWSTTRGTLSASGGVLTCTRSEAGFVTIGRQWSNSYDVQNHKCFVAFDVSVSNTSLSIRGSISDASINTNTFENGTTLAQTNTFYRKEYIYTPTSSGAYYLRIGSDMTSINGTISLKNVIVVDLTKCFGAGNEPSTVADFKALFAKSYYAYDSGTTTCVSAVNGDTYGHYTASLGRTVYGGTLDVVSGVLTVTHGFHTFNGQETWTLQNSGARCITHAIENEIKLGNSNSTKIGMISNEFVELTSNNTWSGTGGAIGISVEANGIFHARQFTSATMTVNSWKTWLESNPLQVCFPLETPQTYQLTPQHVQLLIGTNNVWSDTGDTTLKYADYPTITNSTQFASKPVIKVTGTGTVRIGNSVITITGSGSAMYIDCEIMEAWRISGDNIVSCNEYISATDMPVLESGTDTVFFSSGITGLEITPKWWKI